MSPAGFDRRASLVALFAILGAGACAAQAPSQPHQHGADEKRRRSAAPDTGVDNAQRARLLGEAEAQLAAGDALAAYDSFQRAAMLLHAADTECGIVRAQAQAGRYREALAFGAHAALAHRNFGAGSALYAWLLFVGGQTMAAQRVLDDALRLAPDDVALRQAREQLRQALPRASGALLAPPLRVAPYAHGAAQPPPAACTAGTATLFDGGRAALVPSAAIGGAESVWLRNGLGNTVSATRAAQLDGVGLTRLHLVTPLPAPASLFAAAREPFAGSPGITVEFVPGPGGDAAWPLLYQGFLGRTIDPSTRQLGIDVPPGPRGGPVFESAGRLAGIALAHHDGTARWVPVAAITSTALAEWPSAPAAAAPAAAIDAVYEAALHHTLQVLVFAPG